MIRSQWPSHTSNTKPESPVEARRCTVQLSTGRLYLDAAATPATALLGHDLPQLPPADAPNVLRMLSSLAPGFNCVAIASSYASAAELAENLAHSAIGSSARVLERNALDGEPQGSRNLNDVLIAQENETLARTGRWLASSAWKQPPAFIVVGDALALGSSFGAVLARETLAASVVREATPAPPDAAALSRVAAAIRMVEEEGLLQHGRELADYLAARLAAVRETCPEITAISGVGLFFRIALTPPLTATLIRRRMCERGVLVAADDENRLVLSPPLALRIAEADVITGALRGALLDSPMPTASAPCSACALSI